MQLFCLKCNKPTAYVNGVKPTFCSHCGKPYIESSAGNITPIEINKKPTPIFTISNQARTIQPNENTQQNIDNDDESQDAQYVPKIDKIEFDISVKDLRPARETGKDLFQQGTPNDAKEILLRKVNKTEKISKAKQKQIREETKRNVQEEFKNKLSPNNGRNRHSTEITG